MGALTDIVLMGAGGAGGEGGALSNIVGALDKRKKKRGSKDSGSKPSGGSVSSDVEGGETPLPSYHHGGKVRKTGPARLRKGEVVLTGRQARKMKHRGGGRSRSGGKRR